MERQETNIELETIDSMTVNIPTPTNNWENPAYDSPPKAPKNSNDPRPVEKS